MANDHLTFARRMEMLRLIPEEPDAPISTSTLHRKLEVDYQCTKRTIERDLEALSAPYHLYTETNGRSNFLEIQEGSQTAASQDQLGCRIVLHFGRAVSETGSTCLCFPANSAPI